MARKGPAPKNPDRKVGHPATSMQRPAVTLLPVPRSEIPPVPSGLLKATKSEWAAYWASDPAKIALAVDEPAVERLFRLRDEYRRSMNAYRRRRVVQGSMGQPVVNPLAKTLGTLGREIARLEGELGLTPLARMKLGIAVGAARRTLEEIHRDAERDDDIDEDDPRAPLVIASSDL